jgi:aminomethyltransferase
MSGEELKRTPLYQEHLALGGRMVPFAGWEMPVYYAGIIEEHKATRTSAGIFDVCHMAEFRIFGAQAAESLQRLLTNDIDRIAEVGEAQYTLLCDDEGHLIDDLIVYHTGDLEYMIVANASNRAVDWDWLDAHLPESVERVDESDRTGLIALQGPKALAVIAELAGEDFEVPERFHVGGADLDGVPVLLARTGYTGEDGVEIVCHSSHAAQIWRLLLSFPEVCPCGLGARDTLRLEMGYPLYGSDMDRTVDPISAGLGWAVSLKKGDFIGREVIARIKEHGPERRLVGLTVPDGIPRHGHPVLHGGQEVGKVASGGFAPSLGYGVATAYVPSALSVEGTKLEVAIRRKVVPAVVTKPPFVRDTSLSRG